MKKLLSILLLIMGLSLNAQNADQRSKIKKASNPDEVANTANTISGYLEEQKALLSKYDATKSYQRVIFGQPIAFKEDDSQINTTINTTPIFPEAGPQYNLDGTDLIVGVWDGGKTRTTHVEFDNRLLLGDLWPTFSTHGTHVTGIIMAKGIDPDARGIANNASGIAYYWDNDISEMNLFGESGYLVSNHSYGYNAGGFADWRFGKYDDTSQTYDQIMRTYPYYQIVTSAGNDRNDTSIGQVTSSFGYDLLTGKACSKNALVVAAVNYVPNFIDASSIQMSAFSNWGPTDDGRIKPDISAQGVGVFSTSGTSNTSYTTLQGTSMSSPCIAGLVLLLQQHHNNLKEEFMKSSMVRGLICHTAREAGFNDGPDYEYGWGLANGEAAAELISNSDNNSSILEMNTLANNATFTKNFSINSTQDINVTICWTDVQGALNNNVNNDRAPRLVNNLDLKVKRNGQTYYPWKLNPDFPSDGATNDSDNNVDNIEKVVIVGAEPGVYTIEVKHKGSLSGGNQEFALIGNGSTGLTLSNNDFVFDNTIFVYPNPASNVLNFNTIQDIQITKIVITDLSGKQILTKDNGFDSNTIDISQLAKGVYFATFTSDNNSVVKKFIKN